MQLMHVDVIIDSESQECSYSVAQVGASGRSVGLCQLLCRQSVQSA